MKPIQVLTAVVLVASLLILTAGCGSGGAKTVAAASPPVPAVTVTIAPGNVRVGLGSGQNFTATVSGTANTAVTWSVQEGAAGGTITADSVSVAARYTAPSVAGVFHVIATSVADTTKSAAAAVTVPVSVEISPPGARLDPGGTQQFSATVIGASNTAVLWSVREANGGSITASGFYAAPANPGTFRVVATSLADPSTSVTVSVVVPPMSISIVPTLAGVRAGDTYAFHATVEGTLHQEVMWSVQEGAAGGSISPEGVYTPPATLGSFHVIVALAADPSRQASAAVTVGEHGFVPTGSMSVSRVGHTATRLLNGEVLIAGGNGDCGSDGNNCHDLATAELFNPATGQFRPTGSMSSPRSGHTATLLSDGRVLMLSSTFGDRGAEIYDPTTGTFRRTSSQPAPRSSHTATLLRNGTVLVAGGDDGNWCGGVRSTEIYDPATDSFHPGRDMNAPRGWHTATLMPDGRVLLVGGLVAGGAATTSTDIFDPDSGTFQTGPSLHLGRTGHTASLLPDGRVLLAGGFGDWGDCAMEWPVLSSSEVFDSRTGTLQEAGSTISSRAGSTATLLPDGMVLLVGACCAWATEALTEPSSAELFNPGISGFVLTGSMAKRRSGHTATLLLDGRVLVTGGADGSAEIYQ